MSWLMDFFGDEDNADESRAVRQILKVIEFERKIERKKEMLKNAEKMGNDPIELAREIVADYMNMMTLLDKIKESNYADMERIEKKLRAA